MGNLNYWCCAQKFSEHEEKITQEREQEDFFAIKAAVSRGNHRKEKEIIFLFNRENILKYLNGELKLNHLPVNMDLNKFDEFSIKKKELNKAEKIYNNFNTQNFDYIISKYSNYDHDTFKNYLLKVIDLNFCDEEILKNLNKDCVVSTPCSIPNELQIFQNNRDTFKELLILRDYPCKMLIKPLGYYIIDNKLLLAYDYYENSLEYYIRSKSLDYINKIIIVKNILELTKFLFFEKILSLDLNTKNLRFTENFILKLSNFKTSFDLREEKFELTKLSNLSDTKQIHFAPEIILGEFKKLGMKSVIWSIGIIISMMFSNKISDFDFKEDFIKIYQEGMVPSVLYAGIDDIYIKSMVVGILRVDPEERPSLIDIIDVYNAFVEKERDKLPDIEFFKLSHANQQGDSSIIY